ncbi:uncharacterized protein METZ01_LOCUS491153, partial [marine metagenome]
LKDPIIKSEQTVNFMHTPSKILISNGKILSIN